MGNSKSLEQKHSSHFPLPVYLQFKYHEQALVFIHTIAQSVGQRAQITYVTLTHTHTHTHTKLILSTRSRPNRQNRAFSAPLKEEEKKKTEVKDNLPCRLTDVQELRCRILQFV